MGRPAAALTGLPARPFVLGAITFARAPALHIPMGLEKL
jgi:hypothetical protein